MKKLIALLLISSQAWGGLPPTSVQGQSDASPQTKFNFQVPYNQKTDLGGIKALFETGNKNLLSNASFENVTATTSWSTTKLSGTTFTSAVDSTNYEDGKQSITGTLTAATGEISQDVTPNIQTNSQPMVASCWVKTSATDVQVCARTGGTDIQCNSVSSAGSWQIVPVNFIGPSNGTSVGVSVKNTVSGTETFNVDDCYVGVASTPQNFGQVSQAQLVGTAKITSCASVYDWGTSVTSYTNSPTPGSCSYAVTGSLLAPSTNIAGWQMSGGPGEYMIIYTGWIGSGNSAGGVTYFRISDGTNVSLDEAQFQPATAIGGPLVGTAVWHITENSAFSGLTFQVQAKETSGSEPAMGGTNANPGTFTVYRFPTSSEIAYRPDILPASWSGTQPGNGGGWTTTNSGSYADFSAASTSNTLTQLTNTNFGSVTADSSLKPAIDFTPNRTGSFLICVSGTATNTTAATDTTLIRLVDGSGTVINGGVGSAPSATTTYAPFNLCGIETVANTSTIVLKLQGQVSAGTGGIIQNTSMPLTWSITALNQQLPSPLLMGSVTSSSSGQWHIENATVTCSSSSYINNSGSGFLASVANISSGTCAFTVNSGVFSTGSNRCWANYSQSSNQSNFLNAAMTSATAGTVSCATIAGANCTSFPVDIYCMGPH